MKDAILWTLIIGFIAGASVVIAFGAVIRHFVVAVLQKLTSKAQGQ
jgi:hypothetical protein